MMKSEAEKQAELLLRRLRELDVGIKLFCKLCSIKIMQDQVLFYETFLIFRIGRLQQN